MPRSLRGGAARPSAAPIPNPAGKPEGARNGGGGKRPRAEERRAAGGRGSGDGGEGRSTKAAVAGACAAAEGGGKRKRNKAKAAEEKSAATAKPPVGGKTSGGADGSVEGPKTGSTRGGGGDPAAPFGGGFLDSHGATGRAGTDGAAAADAAAAAAGVVADAAPDAHVMSGCSVSFRREDFVCEAHDDRGYDVVCLFSVVKWMHLNGGDGAVRDVFRKAYGLLRPGGRLILEPQVCGRCVVLFPSRTFSFPGACILKETPPRNFGCFVIRGDA